MSKLDREIKAIIDDMTEDGLGLAKKMFAIMIDDDLSKSEVDAKLAVVMDEAKLTTYDEYIADLKQVFREAGWKEPQS